MRAFLLVFSLIVAATRVWGHPEIEEQIAAVTRGIEREPDNAALYLRRGELHRIHQDWSRALSDYDRAAQRDPKLVVVDLARGQMFLEARRMEEALAILDKFVVRHPQTSQAWLIRARVFAAQGLPARAGEDFARAIATAAQPEPDWFVERASVLADVDAVAGLDEGIKQLGPLVTLVVPALDLELKLKRFDAALARVDALAAQTPRKEMWLVRRGEILELANQPAEARQTYEHALVALGQVPVHRRTVAVQNLEAQVRSAVQRLGIAEKEQK